MTISRTRVSAERMEMRKTDFANCSFFVALILGSLFLPAFQRSPQNPTAENNLRTGIQSIRKGDLREAERILRIEVANHPQSANACYWLGVVCMRQHQSKEAEQMLLKAIELRPNFPEAHNGLGILYDEQADLLEI